MWICNKSKTLYLGVMDTLHGALWLYNTEARKIGKPTQTLPDGFSPVVKSESIPTHELHVPELNNKSTVIPGLRGIHFMTADGTFKMGFPSSQAPRLLWIRVFTCRFLG